ncbi:unannotated protein [freshwater metagenome]|uniref:Unannotated protein n=1 Tax=freshwater metagenome TaxID=449393 RepID=A0A6J7AR61_9ZZZZ
MHHPGGARYAGHHAVASPRPPAPRCDGAVHQRPPARLPHVRRQRRLRTAGHVRRRRSARRALRLSGRQPPRPHQGHFQPVFHVRLVEVHRLLAVCAGVRRGAGHVRAHHRGPRLWRTSGCRCQRQLLRFAVRVLWCLRAGVPHSNAHREHCHRDGSAAPHGAHHVCVLWRRLLVQGRDAGRDRRADDALQGRRRERGPLVREGSVRVGLRQPPRSATESDGAREHHRRMA